MYSKCLTEALCIRALQLPLVVQKGWHFNVQKGILRFIMYHGLWLYLYMCSCIHIRYSIQSMVCVCVCMGLNKQALDGSTTVSGLPWFWKSHMCENLESYLKGLEKFWNNSEKLVEVLEKGMKIFSVTFFPLSILTWKCVFTCNTKIYNYNVLLLLILLFR